MTHEIDDPKWTTYALDELPGSERAELDTELRAFPDVRRFIEETREAAALIREAFALEPVTMLSARQRQAIEERARSAWPRPLRKRWGLLAIAAAAFIALAVPFWKHRSPKLQPTTVREGSPPKDRGPMSSAERTGAPAVRDTARLPKTPHKRVPIDREPSPLPDPRSLDFELPLYARSSSEPLRALLPPPVQPFEAPKSTGVLSGRLIDQTGSVIPGAAISIQHQATGATRKIVSDENGRFEVPDLPPGELRLDIALAGFKSIHRLVAIKAGEFREVDAVLEIGNVTETVTVTGEAPPIQTAVAETRARVKGPAFVGGSIRREKEIGERLGRRVGNDRKPQFRTEAYDQIVDNPFVRLTQVPRATFSIDVDTASYANVRRFLNEGRLPPNDSARIEEMVNYFRYHYPEPTGRDPIAIQIDSAQAPWSPEHRLVRIALRAKDIHLTRRPPSNLVFLIDVSGSMQPANKLPLLKSALRLLTEKLTENDRVSIVVYAGASGLVLPPTSGSDRDTVLHALAELEAGGTTNGASGIQLAYQVAQANFVTGGINRVILATDGDFNVGMTSQGELIRLIQEKAKTGVFLSVLGFGMGNYKDSTLEKLADKGNGNYAYIDTLNEARKVLVEQMSGTLITVAKDVKLQIEFNPVEASAYRLIGYENRVLNHEDFNDDLKDAGDIGAGHSVTAFFEIIPPGLPIPAANVDPLKYQTPARPNRTSGSRELLTAKLRYKEPDGQRSRLLEVSLRDSGASFAEADPDFRFAAAVAAFGMILRNSPYKGSASFESILEIAHASTGEDDGGYRKEFIQLVEKARALAAGGK